MKTKTILGVQWTESFQQDVPVVSATGLEIRAVERLLRFMRQSNPNHARYSPNNRQKGPARAVAQFS
jgi:hypothetical protein